MDDLAGNGPTFPRLIAGNRDVDLGHLQPMHICVPVQGRPGGALIEVRFSNHCFSSGYDHWLHASAAEIWDRGRRRASDQERYDLSLGLPAIIAALPGAHVYQTHEANFVRIANPSDGLPGEYRVYFHIREGRGDPSYDLLLLFVESAYRPTVGRAVPATRMTKVRFRLLVDKMLRGEKPRLHHKR